MINETFTANFLKPIIEEDLKQGRYQEIITRFPPEPNGYLHIGHIKAITIDFEMAKMFNGKTNLRFDDTNPTKEEVEFVNSIKEDVEWLGYKWDNLFYASNYFDEMYERATILIKKGLAYVDDQTAEQISQTRGTLTEPGQNSPYRDRSAEENLQLFSEMKDGKYPDGSKVLRAKIDMAHPNFTMRDPVLYRISHAHHHNTGDKWCIYPMYDYAHPLEDAIEGISHSLCTLEFEDHRPLYEWVIEHCDTEAKPRQIEFSKLLLTNTVLSKRNLRMLVEEKLVDGWDDPRILTIRGLRRRGYTPEAIRDFIFECGVNKAGGVVDFQMLEHFIREDLKMKAVRTMAVVDPLKVVITNYPEGQEEWLEVENNRDNPEMGSRKVPFSREIYIEQEDFMENPIPKYHRLYPGNEVRLSHAYFITCTDVIKDENGKVIEVHATYDPETKSGTGFTGRKVKGTIHWVDANNNTHAEIRLYDHLTIETDETKELPFKEKLNPNSLEIKQGFLEENMASVQGGEKFQFTRNGYFNVDPNHTKPGHIVMNRIVSLKSSFKLK
jgi:glutaminyl-tRNA synthetase